MSRALGSLARFSTAGSLKASQLQANFAALGSASNAARSIPRRAACAAARDGWAIASHIALSILMAMFPLLIVVTALAGFMGSKDLANAVADLLLDTWPQEVAEPIGRQVQRVLTTARGDALTLGALSLAAIP